METKKIVVEVDLSDETLKIFRLTSLRIIDVLETRIRNTLQAVVKGDPIRIYEFGNENPLYLYEKCPYCGHSWAKHFNYLDGEGKRLEAPEPGFCSECVTSPDKKETCSARTVMERRAHELQDHPGEEKP